MNGEFIRFSILRMFCFYNVVKSVWKRNRKKTPVTTGKKMANHIDVTKKIRYRNTSR